MTLDPKPDMVTIVIRHQLKSDAVEAYEQWLKKIIPAAGLFPGHLGVHVIAPPDGLNGYTVTIRFDSLAHAQDWMKSPTRRELVEQITPLLEQGEEVNTVTGMEFWFTSPGNQKHARPYKQFLITLSVIYPLTLVLPWLLGPVFSAFPVLQFAVISRLLIAIIIVGLMTYVVMPRYTRLVSKWLFN